MPRMYLGPKHINHQDRNNANEWLVKPCMIFAVEEEGSKVEQVSQSPLVYTLSPRLEEVEANLKELNATEDAQNLQALRAKNLVAVEDLKKAQSKKDEEAEKEVKKEIQSILAQITKLTEESDDAQRFITLEENQRKCIGFLDELRQPITSDASFEQVVKDWGSDIEIERLLQSDELGYEHLEFLEKHKLAGFFDNELLGNIRVAAQSQHSADQAHLALLGRGAWKKEIRLEAEERFEKHLEESEARIKELEQRGDQNSLEIAALIKAELADSKGNLDWFHKNKRRIEKEKWIQRKKIDQEIRSKLTSVKDMLFEARKVRENEIKNHLGTKQKAVADHAQELFDQGLITDEDLEAVLEENERMTRNMERVFSVASPTILASNSGNLMSMLNRANQALDTQMQKLWQTANRARNANEAVEDERLKSEIENKYKTIKAKLAHFTPERINALIEEERKKDPEQTGIFRQRKAALENLNNLKAGFEELDADIADLKNLDPHQRAELLERIDGLDQKLKPLSAEKIDQAIGLSEAATPQLAQALIRKLRAVQTKEALQDVLQDPAMRSNLEIITDAQFENYEGRNLKDYTGGHMVFYERGDIWKIIINEDALDDIEAVKEQMIHELQHLEFESNNELKQEWRKIMGIEPAKDTWGKIKEAYVNSFPNKRPPLSDKNAPYSINDWKDDDVLSELYAMQDNLATNRTTPLSQALASAGVGAAALGVSPREDGEPIIRGYDKDEESAESILSSPEASSEEGAEAPSGLTSADDLLNSLGKIDDTVSVYLKSDYIGYIPAGTQLLKAMQDYNQDTRRLIDAYSQNKSSYLEKVIKSRIEMVEGDAGEIEKGLEKVSVNVPNTSMNPIREIWNRTTFISIEDLVQVGKDVTEWWDRRHKRKVADHAAKFGMSLFEDLPLPWAGEFGLESAARREKAEADEVNEWKSRLENKDAWDLLNLLNSLAEQIDPNRDQFKAILRILAEKGRIDWRDKSIWKILNKVQGATYLNPDDPLLVESPVVLRQKLHTAMGEVWDYDEFLELDRKNEGSYESAKGDHMKNIDKIQRQIGGRLEQLLKKARQGENVEPMEYEALIEYSITNGKFSAEGSMFYLMAGMAEGILSPDRGIVLDKHLNLWPSVEWIVSGGAPNTAESFKKFCLANFADEFKSGTLGGVDSPFKNFYWTVIQNEDTVIQRIRKSAKERGWDHDWARAIASAGDAESVRMFMSGRSGEIHTHPTAVENMYVGLTQWFEENSKFNPLERKDHFARQIGSFIMAEGIMSDVAYRKIRIYFRKPEIYGNDARETGMGNHPDWNVGQHRDRIKGFVENLDPNMATFLQLLTDRSSVASEDPSEKGEIPNHFAKVKSFLEQNYPEMADVISSLNNMDDVFQNLISIINGIMAKVDDGRFLNAARANLRQGLEEKY